MAKAQNTVSKGISQFSADFYTAAKTANGGTSRNWVFSPFSLSAAFAMLKVGTRGETSSQLEKAFHYPPNNDAALASEFKPIISALSSPGPSADFSVISANRMYIDTDFDILATYQNILETSFGSKIERLKLNPAAASVINKWVENVTHEKIQSLISQTDLDDSNPDALPKFVLVNAIYFLGKWQHPFSRDSTRDQTFFLSERENHSVMVKMMHQTVNVRMAFLKDIDADLFLLPYKGGRFSMLIFLPRARGGLSRVESNLKSIPSLSQLGSQLKNSRVVLSFPKFKIEATIDVTNILPQMGVTLIFSDKVDSDFSGMAEKKKGRLKVTKAVQKAVIIVDEEGTEAGAATAVIGFELYSLPPDLTVDHPFYYQIVDEQNSDLILFAGSCTNPSLN